MFTENENLSLENIGKGAIIEEFDAAFTEVVRGILDHNTSDKARVMTIKAKIIPNSERTLIAMEVTHDVKNPANKPFTTGALIGIDEKGKPYAQEIEKQQLPLPIGAEVINGGFKE